MRGVVVCPEAFDAATTAAMSACVLDSPLLSDSTVRGGFQATRGFAFTFTRAGIANVEARHPALVPFLRAALDPALVQKTARTWRRRLLPPYVNACYLNALVVPAGSAVERHVDATLAPLDAPHTTPPVVVAVAYLRVPPADRGGLLRLYDGGDDPCATVAPGVGHLVAFDGALGHEVTRVAPAPAGAPDDDRARVSLVLEQYALSPERLAQLAPLRVHSRAGFAAFLDDARARGGRR